MNTAANLVQARPIRARQSLQQMRLAVLLLALASSGVMGQVDESVARRAFGGVQPAISPDGRVIALSYDDR